MDDTDDVCVITQPVSDASASHVEDLLTIIGSITHVSLLAANLPQGSSIRDDYEVIDIADSGTGRSIPVAAVRFLRNQVRMACALWRRDESIVLFFGAISYLIPILAAKLSGKTVVLEPRGDVPLTLRLHWQERVPNGLARLLAGSVWLLEQIDYHIADAIVTYTPSMAEELDLDRFEAKLYPDGARFVDTERFAPRVQYNQRDQVVGFLGRLDEEKGIRELAEVAKSLSAETTFVFAGDGDLYEWLQQELSAERTTGSVELTGWVEHEDVPMVLSRFKLLVLPSEPTEGLPTAVLESLACGTPVLTTPVSGVPDVVWEGETGFLIDAVETGRLTETITDILQRDDLVQISTTGRSLIETEYSFPAAVDRYERIIREISTSR
jgi:glycosyltransferase involved in cell wall biosynthesis